MQRSRRALFECVLIPEMLFLNSEMNALLIFSLSSSFYVRTLIPTFVSTTSVLIRSAWQVAADLVREFLEHFQLHSTLAVFVPEANQESSYPGRAQLAQRLGIEDDSGLPLLMAVMKQGSSGSRGAAPARAPNSSAAQKPPVSPAESSSRSPARESPQSHAAPADSKFAFGGGGGAEKGLGSLADMPPLTGAGKRGGDASATPVENDGMAERVRKLQSLAQEGAERRSPQGESESDESLTRSLRALA